MPDREIAAGAACRGSIRRGGRMAERRKRRQRNTQDPAFSELLEHALEHHWKPRCRTWKQMEQTFNTYSAGWKHRRLSTVRRIDVMQRHGRIGRENGTYVANRWRSLVHRLYEIAAADFDFPGANPARRVKPFPEQERERFVTPEELPRLFDAIDTAPDARIADFLRLALHTGARKGALFRMKFADIDLARAVWTDTPSGLYSTESCRFRRRHPAAASVCLAAPRAYPSLPSSRLSRSPMSLGTRKTNSFPFFFSSKTPRFARSSRSVRAV